MNTNGIAWSAGELVLEHQASIQTVVALALLALATGAFFCWRYLPRRLLTVALFLLRAIFLAALAWCLLMPTQKLTHRSVRKPRFAVLLDASGSMALSPDASVPARMDAARAALRAPWPAAIRKQCEIDGYAFSTDLIGRMEPEALLETATDGPASHIRENLNRLFARYPSDPPAGVLLLTDALDTREGDDAWADGPWPSPIYTVPLEPEDRWKAVPDVRVASAIVPRRIVVGWDADLKVMVGGEGAEGRPVPVRLFEGDRVVQESSTRLPRDNALVEVTFPISHSRVGTYTYRVEAVPLPGEINTNDNVFALSVLVTDTRNRVLYIEDVPRWESKYRNRALEKMPDVISLSFVRGPGGRYLTYGRRGSMTPDLTAEQLAAYRVVVVGDFSAEELTEARAADLVKFVEDGGSLVLLGGPKGWGPTGFRETRLKNLLPVQGAGGERPDEGRFPVRLTDEGKAHAVFQWIRTGPEALPPVLSVFPGGTLSPAAVLLAHADVNGRDQPLLAVQRYGQGKVAAVLTDSLWRWSVDPAGGKAYAAFWNHLLQWMLPEKQDLEEWQLELACDRNETVPGEAVTFDARLGGRSSVPDTAPRVACAITLPDGRTVNFPMSPGVTSPGSRDFTYQVAFVPEHPGAHTARAETKVGDRTIESAPLPIVVGTTTPELNPKAARLDLLRRIAVASGGAFAQVDVLEGIMAGHAVKGADELRVEYKTLWNTPGMFIMMAALLVSDWLLRRLRGMV